MSVLQEEHIPLTIAGMVDQVTEENGFLQLTFSTATCKFMGPTGHMHVMSFAWRPLRVFAGNQSIRQGDRVQLRVLWDGGRQRLADPTMEERSELIECASSITDISPP